MTDLRPDRIDIARVQKDLSWAGFRLILGQRGMDGGFSAVLPVTLEQRPHGGSLETACMLTKEAAQELMDDLWSDGVRPTRQRDVAGEVEWLREQLGRIIGRQWK